MAEIGSTSSASWPVNKVVPTVTDNKQFSKQQQKKNRGNSKTNEEPTEQGGPTKKRPPDSDVNSHIDEYA